MALIDIVCDASVVLKWFHANGEDEVEASRALLDLHRSRAAALSVLDLTAYEVGNALLRGWARADARAVAIVLDALAVICPRITLSQAELADAVTIATRHDLTLYDAAYAAAATARHAHLATLDRALLDAGLGMRPSCLVSMRRSLQTPHGRVINSATGDPDVSDGAAGASSAAAAASWHQTAHPSVKS